MSLSRLIYVSENLIDASQGNPIRQLNAILGASNRNNREAGITGALIFDDLWFIQALEGERRAIWRKFEHLKDDDRHTNVTLVEMVEVPERLFGNWWMGLASRKPETEHLFAPFVQGGRFRADLMSADDILALMTDLAGLGLRRELAAKTPDAMV